jgi:hypothetical protein
VFSYSYVNTNPSCLSRLSCQFFSNRCASLRDDPIILPIRKFNSQFSHRCLFHLFQVAFVFPALPPFFFKDSDFLTKYPSYGCEVSSFFPSMFLSGVSSWRCSGVSSSSFFHSSFFFLLRWIQCKLLVLIISLSSFHMLFHASAPLNHSPPAIHLFRSAEDISEESCFHSASIQANSRLLSHSSQLINRCNLSFE